MRQFMTILVAVVLCLAAFAVCASAKNTNCTATSDGVHDWTAWKTVQFLRQGYYPCHLFPGNFLPVCP